MGFFDRINRAWSGADFWQGDENRKQRDDFQRRSDEERDKKRQQAINTAFEAPRPGTTFNPVQTQTPNVNFDPSQPLQKFDPIASTGFNNPILDMPKVSPEEAQQNKQKREATETLERLTQANMEKARKDATQGEGFLGRNLLNRKAIEERAKTMARTRATKQYQEKYGYNKEAAVLDYGKQTSELAGIESTRLQKDMETLNKVDDAVTKAGETASYVPVTGSVLNLGLAASEKIYDAQGKTGAADDIESKRLEIDAGMTKDEFDQLAPQASEEEFEQISEGINGMSDQEFLQFKSALAQDIKQQTGEDVEVDFSRDDFLRSFNMDTQQKIRNMQNLGLLLSPLDFVGAAGLAKSGVTSAGKAAFRTALKQGGKVYASKEALKAGGKVAAKKAVAPFIAGSALSVGAQGYLGGMENVNLLDAAKTGGLVAGTSMLFPSSTTLKKGGVDAIDDVARVTDDVTRNVDSISEAQFRAAAEASQEGSAIKKTASLASDEGDSLAGTRRVPVGENTPSVQVEDGVKSTNAAKIPDPNSPIALGRADEFSSDAPIANFDNQPVEPGQLQRDTPLPSQMTDEANLQSRIDELSLEANDLDVPAYQRSGAKRALESLTNKLDDQNAASLDTPLDRPAFQHKNDIEGVIAQGNDELDSFLRENPDATVPEIEAAKQAIESQVLAKIENLQTARFGNTEVDNLGNPVLRSDTQLAREALDQGAPLQRGGSVAAANEGAMESAARQAVGDEVVTTTPEVNALLSAVEDAQGAYDDVAKVRSGERGQRIAAGRGSYESAGGGEAGYRAKLGQLKGKLSESQFNPANVDPEVQNSMLDAVERSGLRDFEKLTAQRGLRKVWGADSGKPVPSELQLIRKVFGKEGDEIANIIEQALEEAPKTWREKVVDIAGIPRTAMTAFDLSMGLRQGSGVMFTNFPQWVNANKESVKYALNSKTFDTAMNAIKNDDAFTMITDKMGVRLPGAIGEGAELMSSKDILEKIPVYGKIGVAGSNRAYTGGLTKLRYNVAKQYIKSLGGIDELAKMTDTQLKDLGEVVNTFTGTGGKAGGITDKNIQTLSSTLFAPRLWASRLNMLNPRFYQRLSPVARKAALKNMGSFMAAATATTGLLEYAIPGVEVEKDPRSSDFLKIKVGNTRYDIFSGLQQNIVLAARLATGQKKSSTTGDMVTLGDGFGDPSRFDVGIDALQNKFNPVLGLASRYLQSGPSDEGSGPFDRTDKFGEEYNVGEEIKNSLVPLSYGGIEDTYEDTGDFAKSALMNIPGVFGVGVQTYGDIPTKEADRYENAENLKDQRKQLTEEGIPMTADGIGDLAKTGDYSNAVRGAEYRLAELEADEDSSEASKMNARSDLEEYKFGEKYGYTPSSDESVQTRAERGEYEAAIAGWQFRMDRDEADGNTPESSLKKTRDKIARYEVFEQYNVEPDMAIAYEKTDSDSGGVGVTAWRDLMESGDPELVAYAEKLYNLDKALLDAGAIKEQKYYWKKGGGGRGGSGSSPRFETNIGTLSAPGFSFQPQQLQRASFEPRQGEIPVLAKTPNFSREKKQISVKRGRQL